MRLADIQKEVLSIKSNFIPDKSYLDKLSNEGIVDPIDHETFYDQHDLNLAVDGVVKMIEKGELSIEGSKYQSELINRLRQNEVSVQKSLIADQITDHIIGYRNLRILEDTRSENPITSSIGNAKWSKSSKNNFNSSGFSSSYNHIKSILEAAGIKDGCTFIDIGSGYGRVGNIIGANYPNSIFYGYEIVEERVIEAQRIAKLLEFDNVNYFHADVSVKDFNIPKADWMFFYDSLNDATLKKIFENVSKTKEKDQETYIIGKDTGHHSEYSNSPYLEYVRTYEGKEPGEKAYFYRFK